MADSSNSFLQRGITALKNALGKEASASLLQPGPLRSGEAACFYFPLPLDYTGYERRLRISFPNRFPHALLQLSVEPSPWLVWPHAMPTGLCLYGFKQRPITGTPELIVQDSIARLKQIFSLAQHGANPDLRNAEFYNEITSYWSIQLKESRQNVILLNRPKSASTLLALSDPRQAVPSGQETVWLATETRVLSQHYKRMVGRSVSVRDAEIPGFYVKLQSYPDLHIPPPGLLLPWLLPHMAHDDALSFRSWFENRNAPYNRWIILELPGNNKAPVYCINILLPGSQRDRGRKFGLRTARRRPEVIFTNGQPILRTATLDILDQDEIYSRDIKKIYKTLEKCRVVCVGVGSLGGAVALQLARAGVGHVTLIDPDKLVSANIGRHVLGTDDIGKYKVLALRERIRKDLPLTNVATSASFAELVLLREPAVFDNADLVVITTADWHSESCLWSAKSNGRSWGLVQAWSEPNALVGHAIFAPDGTYDARELFCENGNFKFKFTEWPDDGIVELPACGESFIPGGSLGMANIAMMTSHMVIDALTGRIKMPTWTSTIYRIDDVDVMNGRYIGPELPAGMQQCVLKREWPVMKGGEK